MSEHHGRAGGYAEKAVHDILRGGYDKVYEAGALITGGHSILDDEPNTAWP